MISIMFDSVIIESLLSYLCLILHLMSALVLGEVERDL